MDNLLSRLSLIQSLAAYVGGEAALFDQSTKMRYVELTNSLKHSHTNRMYILAYDLLDCFVHLEEEMQREDRTDVYTMAT